MSYGNRLKKVRKELGLTQNELANMIGLKNKQTISDIETGKQQRLSAKHELAFCTKYEIDILWLQMGDESFYTHPSNKYILDESSDDKQNISLFYYPHAYTHSEDGDFISLQNKKMMTFHKDFIEVYLGLKSYKNLFIIDSIGESMEPTLSKNALIFINPIENESTIKEGSIYMLACSDVVLVKRVYRNPIEDTYTLLSDHAKHDDMIITHFKESGCRLIGRVVGTLNKL
jgi:transcriptional regulator with XRE-family HTH domain